MWVPLLWWKFERNTPFLMMMMMIMMMITDITSAAEAPYGKVSQDYMWHLAGVHKQLRGWWWALTALLNESTPNFIESSCLKESTSNPLLLEPINGSFAGNPHVGHYRLCGPAASVANEKCERTITSACTARLGLNICSRSIKGSMKS